MKAAKIKSIQNKESIKSEIDILIKNKIPFQLILSNYTTTIKSDIDFFNKTYIAKEQEPVCFLAYNKIKKDIAGSTTPKPLNERERCEYYSIKKTLKTGKVETVFNIDIKSAYATLLYNYEFITKETFDFICSLKKPNRLSCVGMIAGRKSIYNYEKGEIISTEDIISENEAYFYFCVKQTFEIMKECENYLNTDFIFSWVDGIYFIGENNIAGITEILKKHSLLFSLQNLKNFSIKKNKNIINIAFIDAKERKKIFSIPVPNSDFKKHLLKYYNLI